MRQLLLVYLFIIIGSGLSAQFRTDSLLQQILKSNQNPVFQMVNDQPDKYRLQIIYVKIDRDKKNIPVFQPYYFHYNPDLYFNPASMVKMPLAFLSLEKMKALKKKKLDKYTVIQFDSSRSWHRPFHIDTTSLTGKPTLAHLIKRSLLISENDPYNRMYQLVGQQQINHQLHEKGFKNVRIIRQFLGLDEMQNSMTNPVRWIDAKGNNIYFQPEQVNTDPFDFSKKITVGKAHWNRYDSLIHEPYDFTRHNYISLEDMQKMLQTILFPTSMPVHSRFDISRDDYQFLYRYLSQYPSETPDPKYDTSLFYDNYVKFFFRNNIHGMPQGVRVFNKVGWSYGFLTDVSYVADFRNKVEFMLAATLYVNSDEVINDSRYEYETVGHPYLYQLGQTIYQYELKRERKHHPDLSSFDIRYEKRDPRDKRPALKEVDN